jgi:hypothetical protein
MATLLRLNGIDLSAALIWQDRHEWAGVEQSKTITLGGRAVIEHAPLSKGRPITIVSEASQGWVDHTTMLALRALAGVSGGVFTLEVHTGTYLVMFRHHEAPAFNATPLIKRLAPDAGDWFLITMKLITV